MNRRHLLIAGATATAVAAPPSDRIRMGVIGAGGRGRYLMNFYREEPGVHFGAVCDVYEPHLEAGLSIAKGSARAYRNYKALLDDKDIDAVIIATPDHWHTQMLLDAIAAGKDVYVEKPLCNSPAEGVAILEAVGLSDRIVQVGMQRRSYDLFIKAREVVAQGTLGHISMVRSWWLDNILRLSTKRLEGPLDWKQFQGSAPSHSADPLRYFEWRRFTDYSGGPITDVGPHVIDGIAMLMGAGFPAAVNATAAPVRTERVDTPETLVVAVEYPERFLAVFSLNYDAMKYKQENDQLTQLDGDKARLDIGREQFAVYQKGQEATPVESMRSAQGFQHSVRLHVRNFLDCVRTRRQPSAPVEVGFQAALVGLMANESLRLGRKIKWNRERMRLET